MKRTVRKEGDEQVKLCRNEIPAGAVNKRPEQKKWESAGEKIIQLKTGASLHLTLETELWTTPRCVYFEQQVALPRRDRRRRGGRASGAGRAGVQGTGGRCRAGAG